MRALQIFFLQLLFLALADIAHSFQFTNTAFNPVLGQQFTITWIDSTGPVTLHLAPIQYYNASNPLAKAVSIGVVTSGNSLSWTPDASLHAGVYRIYWIPSENTQSEVDSPTFTLGNIPTSSSTNTNSASHSQIPSTSPIESNPSTGATVAPTTHPDTALASSVAVNTQPETNQSISLTNTIKITIAISIILAITLIMLVAFILLRRQRYLATIPRTKRQLTTKEIADDGDSWCEEHYSKPGAPAESEAMARSLVYIDLRKEKKHRSVNVEPVELDTYIGMKDMKDMEKMKETKEIRTDEQLGLGLGLGDIEELVEPKELDSWTIVGQRDVARKKFNVRSNVNIVGI